MKYKLRRSLAAILLFLVSTLGFLLGLFDATDRFLGDTLYTSFRSLDPRIFVIGIDSDSLDRYGPWGSWSRKLTADLISYLNEDPAHRPAAIGVDLMFFGNTTDRDDGALVDAAQKGGNVVFASQAIFSKELTFSSSGESWNYASVQKYEQPFDDLRAVAPSGIMNAFADPDGIVRRSLYQVSHNGEELRCFADQVTQVYADNSGFVLPPRPKLDARGEWFIPFAAKPGDYYGSGTKGTSWVRVMDGEIPREMFENAIVLVGPYSAGMMDSFFTAADRRVPMYGVEIHANIIQSLLEGYYRQTVPGFAALLLTAAISVLLCASFFRFGVRTATFTTFSVCLAYFLGALGIFRLGWMLPITYPIVTFVLLYLALLITNYVFLTVEKASLYDQMHQLFVNSIRTIANTIDAKDPCTSGHCQRVSDYSLMLGRSLHFTPDELSDLEYAALLHDVGKIGVSDSVLKKEGPLTNEEYEEMKTHPLRGAAILNEIQEFRGRILEGAKYHHERYDGKGYCEGMAGEAIPLFGRIIAIADTYDAMTQNRPYRRRLPKEVAVSELRRGAGTQFDPTLVQLFIQILEKCPEPDECAPEKEAAPACEKPEKT